MGLFSLRCVRIELFAKLIMLFPHEAVSSAIVKLFFFSDSFSIFWAKCYWEGKHRSGQVEIVLQKTPKQGRFRIPGYHNGSYIFHFPEVHCSRAYFSPDANNEHLNKSVLTSSSAARLGLKFILLYLFLDVTGLLKASFFCKRRRIWIKEP